MGKSEEVKEVIYEKKNIVIKAVIFSIILITALIWGVEGNIKILLVAINLIILMGSFTVVFLILAILKVYKEQYFKNLIYSYIILIILSILSYLKLNYLEKGFLIEDGLKKISFVIAINIIVLLIKAKIACSKDCVRVLLYIVASITTLYLLPWKYIGVIGLTIAMLVILVKVLYLLKDFDFTNEDMINYIKFNVYIIMVIEVLVLLGYFLNIEQEVFIWITIASFILFVINFVSEVNKVINNPYKSLYRDLYDETIKISSINKKLQDKNLELERNQILVKRKEKMFKLFFEKAPIGIVMISAKNGRILYCNNSFLEILGIDNIRDIINKSFKNIITMKDNDELGNDNLYSGEFNIGSEKFNLELRVIDINRKSEIATIIVYDSTEKRKVEVTKEKIRKELLEEEIKREFLSNITHDLKTPVNVIYSATQLEGILIDNKNIEEIAKYNFICKQNCKALISLTNNLIDSSKMNTNYMKPNLNPLNIVDIIEGTVQSLAEYAKINKIDLIFDTNDEDIVCNMDGEFLTRIITNLVSNSIKFTDEGGEIRVGVQNLFNGFVKIEVVDDGVGMDDYFLKIAFERYSMDREEGNNVSGTGIGLFVVKKFINLLDGEIIINSDIGVGTRVEIFFKIEG